MIGLEGVSAQALSDTMQTFQHRSTINGGDVFKTLTLR